MNVINEERGNRDQIREELGEVPKKEKMLLVLYNMRRLGSRYEREVIDEIIDLIEDTL